MNIVLTNGGGNVFCAKSFGEWAGFLAQNDNLLLTNREKPCIIAVFRL